MSLAMQGPWTVSVKTKNAAFPQRFTITGASSGNGTHVVSGSVAPVVVTGAHWTIAIDAQDGSVWIPSAMRYKNPVASGGLIHLDIESNDPGNDEDFDDLVLTCTMPQTGSDFVLYGHATAYSGFCIFNPCMRFSIVIDGPLQLASALKNGVARAAIEKLYPERLLPVLKNPPDPGPLATFTPLVLPTPRSASMSQRAFQVTRGKGAAVERQVIVSPGTAASVIDSQLTAQLGQLLDGSILRFPHCTTTTLGNYGLAFQQYDRTSSELSGGAYTGTGPRENLGTTATDAFGNYVFRFSRSLSDVVDEVLNDVAVGENASVAALPDIIAQVLGAGQIANVETACFFNVQALQRLDICVPATGIVLPSSCADNQILTFIGKISLTTSLNSLDTTGRITATSTAGNAPTIACGVWWGNLDLWGCFGNASVACYTVRSRPLGGSSSSWQFHAADETRVIGGGSEKKIGPFFDLALAVPLDPSSAKVTCPRYLNAEIDPTIVQPGAFLKATLGSSAFAAGPYEVRIDAYDASGNLVRGESITLFVDNQTPNVQLGGITLAGVPVNIGTAGCTLQTLAPADLSADLSVRYLVDHTNGAILDYAVGIARCNEGAGFPVSYVGGGQPSFTWVHDDTVNCETPPNFREGTIEDPDNDGSGFVTTTLAPVNPWLSAAENFTILRVTISFNWRATNGYWNASGVTYGPWVWGIQK